MIKNFRLNILIRLLVLTVLIALLTYFLLVEIRYLRSIYLAVFLALAIGEFVWYVDRTNRDFTTFLLSLLQNDFTTTFSEKTKGKSFNQLYTTFNKITKKFEQISSAKEVQHLYLEALVDHIRVGIISFDKKGKIHLMNQAFQKMLDRPSVAFLNNLNSVDNRLPEAFKEIKPKENKLLKVQVNNELLQLSIHASEFILDDTYYKLISVQNIKNELDSNELDAWQKLIRVLTHEIMNSVTPITSLSGSLKQLISNKEHDADTINKVTVGLEAIESRSKGLQNFTDAYRKLTKIPIPKFSEADLGSQLDKVLLLLKEELKGIKVTLDIEDEVKIISDQDLMDQVFINLIKNALEALANKPDAFLSIKAWQQGETYIVFHDNGSGIEPDKLDQVFVPFFTTKNEGSGIGLALSRQIVRLHNGSIDIKSTVDYGTTVTIMI